MKKFLGIIVVSFFYHTLVYGFCYAPTPPSNWNKPIKPMKPSVPFCINEWNNTHTCDEWTINSYNSDVDYYNSQLQNYKYEVDNYIRELQNFARRFYCWGGCSWEIICRCINKSK